MNILFIGGVKFSYDILEHILKNNFKISTIFSYKDSKKKYYSDISNFDDLSKKYDIPNIKIDKINDKENVEIIKKLNPDLILIMGWSQLLKPEIIQIPKLGVIGSHPTELPKYRGRAPIPWTIIKNLKESALTFFYIQEGVDDGDILDQRKFKINSKDDATSIYEKITDIGKRMILQNLKLIEKGKSKKIKQDKKKFLEYWIKRTPEDGQIDWDSESNLIHDLIRASTAPYPGAFSRFKNKKLIIWKSELAKNHVNEPGKILEISKKGVKIGTKSGCIIIKKVSFGRIQNVNANEIFTKTDIGKILN
jgi:methionyl-tRNA formyltransferase|tara:strand:+ start:2410 stop:3330 length:921 start_codon:yes stop_codon:yes gene_type:complete